jgi:fructan beta-fructosidase
LNRALALFFNKGEKIMTQTYSEQYRPQFHFSPEEKWMNDPNGMVFFNDEYHLFYQYHPFGTTWGPMHWGHAVSKDMIHWEHLPIALYPDELGAIFSGSAVVDWNNTTGFFEEGQPGLVAIYTSAGTYPDSDRPQQQQSLAYSKDNGRTWTKYEGNPVLSDVNITDYRDPKVFWHQASNKWVMVLATGQTVTIYNSQNLKEWEFASEFGHHAGSHEGVWECPDLFELPVDGSEQNSKWVMLVSIGDNGESKEGSRTQYFVGQFDGTTFVNDNDDSTILWLDYGRDNYAGVSWSDMQDGRRVYIGWMSNWRYANLVPTKSWRSAMTLPRELSLSTTNDGIRVFQKPVAEVSGIRGNAEEHGEFLVTDEKPISVALRHPLNELQMELEGGSSNVFGFSIKHSETEKTVICYDRVHEKLLVDRSHSGENDFSASFPTVQEAPLKLENNKVSFQLFIDHSSIELFVNDGEIAVTSLIFPSHPGRELVFFSEGGDMRVTEMKVIELSSIWSR